MSSEIELINRLERRVERLETRPRVIALGDIYATFAHLPGVRGFWPMNQYDQNGNIYSLANDNSLPFLLHGAPYFGYRMNEGTTWVHLDGTNDYYSIADHAMLDILGTETIVWSGGAGDYQRGLTIGGWFFNVTGAEANVKGLIGKYNDNAVNQRSYLLYKNTSGYPSFVVSNDGTATNTAVYAVVMSQAWHFCVGRFIPSVAVDLFYDGVKTTAGTAFTTLFNSTAELNLGAYSNGQAATRWQGYASLAFVCGMALPDSMIQNLFNLSRTFFEA